MLEQVLQHLNNWFLVPDGIHSGEYTVQGGGITLPFLQIGQYFRVVGSVFNDGLHQYPAADMTDETFAGSVWALAVPKAVIAMANEIDQWQTKNAGIIASPFTSESFGGYSYTKSSSGSTGASVNSWKDVFRGRLNDWRRIGGII